jgi:hypothetical protein
VGAAVVTRGVSVGSEEVVASGTVVGAGASERCLCPNLITNASGPTIRITTKKAINSTAKIARRINSSLLAFITYLLTSARIVSNPLYVQTKPIATRPGFYHFHNQFALASNLECHTARKGKGVRAGGKAARIPLLSLTP